MQNKGLKIFFVGIFFIGFFFNILSAEADPPNLVQSPTFDAILQKIQAEKQKIQAAKKEGDSCSPSVGDSVVFRFRLGYLGAKDFIMSKLQIGKSKCFLRDQGKIEREIVNLVHSFSKSTLACREAETQNFFKILDELEGLLSDFRNASGNNPEYATKDCAVDARAEIFAQTLTAFERLKQKIKEIAQNIQSIKSGSFFSFNSASIQSRAQQNADDFWGDISRIFDVNTGLKSEYNRISSRVRGLGSGTSFYAQPVNGSYRDGQEILKKFEEKRAEVEKKLDTFLSLIEEKKKTESEEQEYSRRYAQRKISLEGFLDFDMALSDIGQVPLVKMKSSIDATSESLENALIALKKYNNRTNVEKETK